MKINATATIILTLLTISLLGLTIISKPATSTPSPTIQVSPGELIQTAINTASPGDTILVAAGIYHENVVINQTVTLMGSGYNVTFIEPSNKAKPAIDVKVNNANITKFTIQGGSSGVRVIGHNFINISDNIIKANQYEGIDLESSLNNTIVGNVISLNGFEGIYLQFSNKTTISNNIISGNSDGVGLMSANNNRISNNTIAYHSKPGGTAIYSDNYNYNEPYASFSNTIDGNTIRNNSIGISISQCNSSVFHHNNFINNTIQVDTIYSTNSWNTTTEGNYWSDYTGTPLYTIDEDNKDYFPLSSPWNPPADVTPPVTADDYDGLWHTANFTVNLEAVDDLSGVKETYYKISGGSVSSVSVSGQPYITTENSNNTVEYWSEDKARLNETHHILTNIKLDETPPSGSIQINNGAAYTTSLSVTLNLSAADSTSGVAQMRFSNNGTSWTQWEIYNTIKAWNLTSGDRVKTVYVQYKDAAGLVSQVFSDTVILDTASPTVFILSPLEGSEIKSSDITIQWNGTDLGSGIDHYEIGLDTDSAINVGIQTAYTFRGVGDGSHTAYVRAFDRVGQQSEVSVDFVVNTSPLGGVGYFEEAALVVLVIVIVVVLVYFLRARRKRRP